MKNKTMVLISIIMIVFLIATSHNPQVVQAEEQTPETGTYTIADEAPETQTDIIEVKELEGQGWESLKLELEDIPMASDRGNYYSIPGLAFIAHDSNVSYYNAANGCIASTQNDGTSKVFVAPLTIPYNSKLKTLYIKYYNFVNSPDDFKITIFRNHFYDGTTETVNSWYVSSSGTGWKAANVGIGDHVVNTSIYAYWAEIKLPQGIHQGFCHFQIYYREPIANPFAVAVPIIQK